MLLEILVPGVPTALYGVAGATVNVVLKWKPIDSALWPLTAHQRGFTHARRADPKVIEALETEMGFRIDLAEALQTIENERYGVPMDRIVSGPHPGPECLCGPCQEKTELTRRQRQRSRGETLDLALSKAHLELDGLHRSYHRSPTVEKAAEIREAEARYQKLLERKNR